jgi:hypothetical protein
MVDFGRQMDAASINWTLLWRSGQDFLGADPMPAPIYFGKEKCA